MLRHLSSTVPVQFLFLLMMIFPFLSCAFVDLRPIGMRTVPEGAWALLSGEESPVILIFDSKMEKSSVEKALQIYSPDGVIDGELEWKGRDLHFTPYVPWRAGIRYGLKISGTMYALDGRELLLSKDIPFFAVSRLSLPYVRSFSPPDSSSVGTGGIPCPKDNIDEKDSDPVILELVFSHPMDRYSTVDALKLDIPGEKIFLWLDDDKTLRVCTDKPLNPWAVYRWSISEKALSREGTPLAKEFSGRFITDLDREFPRVIRVIPLLPPESYTEGTTAWGSWLPAGTCMNPGPGSGHGIGVEFNKPVDADSLRRAFSFTPSLPGRVEILSPVSAVYIPQRDPEPEIVYSMRISGSLKDNQGLAMGEDFIVSFMADIPFLCINSVSFDDETVVPEPDSLFPVSIESGGIIRIIINFSLLFDAEDTAIRQECVFRISLRPFFPGTLPPLSLRTARWLFSDRLLLEWEGAEGSNPGEAHFYKLLIPGGSGGVHNGKGSFLKSDFVLYLEADA